MELSHDQLCAVRKGRESRARTWLPTRRTFLLSLAAGFGAGFRADHSLSKQTSGQHEFYLRAAAQHNRLVPEPYGETETWCYNGQVPGPEIRVKQGERLLVVAENGLEEETTVHWHGVRLPHAMDGVPHLTQQPIAPGGKFTYQFEAKDAGTFWYHPHQNSAEQVGRGLYGPLIVEEADPVRVDRDITWILDDWRLTRSAAIRDDFGNRRDMSHNGRIGNTVTINGRIQEEAALRTGERIRLRLINTANARIFGLEFTGHRPVIIALDGQPVAPHEPDGGLIVLGPAMRADLILDGNGAPGSRAPVVDRFYEGRHYRLIDLHYEDTPLRPRAPDWAMDLPANPLPEPDLMNAIRHKVILNGGMMGPRVMAEMGGSMAGDFREMMHAGKMWFINGIAAEGPVMAPMLTLAQGRSHIIATTNATAWHHPMHLHGHSFRVLSRDGQATRHREWQDTVLMAPRETVEIALVADNPGDWMFHCHILEHQMGVIRVA